LHEPFIHLGLEEASTTFADPLHSAGESRYVLLARSATGRLLVVVHVERGDTIRLVSARPATHAERKTYEETD
jgi:uncharacterized DUF497 family protein